MNSWKISASVLCCWLLTTGCRICEHPSYDCGPVWSQDNCPSCNPDYRAGSILNREARAAQVSQQAAGVCQPALQVAKTTARAVEPAQVGPRGPTCRESKVRFSGRGSQTPPKNTVKSEAASPDHLPPSTVAAPPGAKEGDTHLLSVTDRRLDELQRTSKPVAIQGKTLQQTTKKPSAEVGGWHPAVPRRDPEEIASPSREISR